ncbi:YaiO family outer membrane beta-barrel protein [Pontibacter sp. 172403-2]|uniref:YaiO family outer membrane beta-barrel protein n=1 Tax=Pontibacter rufus TaxID=2791028 RepID=UPI0018AFDF50|nr:YaiO family outer membrane beta-barrel protein [Pontibacter sp. 172403-2]MBF9254524.1 YaiO family outer membrane beta-barrel protein [Pontibacter sp. 172403-2]
MKLTSGCGAALCLCLSFLLFSGALQAQVPAAKADSLFRQAQELAYKGRYKYSRQLGRQVLQAIPAYTDATLLIARTYAWEQQYDSARVLLQPLLQKSPARQEALLLLADIELWSHAPEKALSYSNSGLAAAPAAVPFLLRKARALYAIEEYEDAATTLDMLLKQEPENKDALKIKAQVQQALRVDILKASYQVTAFDQHTDAWHLGALEYTHQTSGSKYLARVSYAQRYGDKSLQGELDAYPQLSRNTYAYLNIGASDKKLFPSYRTGAELYHVFPHVIEASLGARGLFFPDETVVLYTGSVGKYFPKKWLNFRSFLQRTNNEWQTTGILQLRQYLKSEEDYLTLVLGKGSVPSEQVGFREISRLNSTRAGLDAQFRLGKKYLLGGTFTYEYEEYAKDSFRSRYTVGISVLNKF